jgi:hypothetical protein
MRRLIFLAAIACALAVPSAASAAWSGVSFDNGASQANDVTASCGEAGIFTAASINTFYGAGSVTGAAKHNCPGPHPNASAKYERWTNSAGNKTWECLYDEDAGNTIDRECSEFSGFRSAGFNATTIFLGGSFDGTASCGEANFWTAVAIDDIWGSAAITGAYSGNCGGPHPNGSAKWSQWGGPGGNVWYDCLYDEDAPSDASVECRGPDSSGRYPSSPVR